MLATVNKTELPEDLVQSKSRFAWPFLSFITDMVPIHYSRSWQESGTIVFTVDTEGRIWVSLELIVINFLIKICPEVYIVTCREIPTRKLLPARLIVYF